MSKLVRPSGQIQQVGFARASTDAGVQRLPGAGTFAVRYRDNREAHEPEFDTSGGRLKISTSMKENGPAPVTVADTGTGIAPENLERIFDLYFSTKEDGSGLGLALAANIVRDHSGEISVTSSLGTGSEFTITIP